MRSPLLASLAIAVTVLGGLTACAPTDDSGVPSWLRPASASPSGSAPTSHPSIRPYTPHTVLPPQNTTAPVIPTQPPADNYAFDGYRLPHTTKMVLHLGGQSITPSPTAVQIVGKCFVQFQVTKPTTTTTDMRLATEDLLGTRTADLAKQYGTVSTIRVGEAVIPTNSKGLQAFGANGSTKNSLPIFVMYRLVATPGYTGFITARVFHDGSSMSITNYCTSSSAFTNQNSMYVSGA